VSRFTPEWIAQAIAFLIALILSIAVHEFGHAFVADRLGDGLPRSQGRVTLNPLAHIDPIGTLVMPILILVTNAPLLGWGRPVLTNPGAYTRRLRMKTGHLLVAAAGPAMNVVLAVVTTLVYFLYLRVAASPNAHIASNLDLLIRLNWTLAFFNLLPLPPLDGGTVLRGILPDSMDALLSPLERYGSVILLALLVTGLLSYVLIPVEALIGGWRSLWGLP
jgi:Zn-dependent protease